MQNPFARALTHRDGLPVLPGAFPLVGHIPAVYKEMPRVIRRARAELGPLFWITTGMGTWLLLASGPEALEILKSKSFTSAHLRTIAPLVAGESVLSHDGESHRHMRGALNKPFTVRGLSASTVGPMMARVLADLAARWAERGEARVLPEIQETALEVIFRMLGVDAAELPAWRVNYRDLLLANLNIKIDLPGFPARRAARAKAWIDARFLSLVKEARRNPDAETLLGVLASAEDDDGKLSDQELIDNLRLLVLGGHETISSTMAWMTITLAARRELWDELADEVKGASGLPATPGEARAFPFAEALFRETVRIHPPFGTITRMALENTTVHGKRVPAGTLVGVDSLWGIAHDEASFPEPDVFKPSRWQGRSGPPSALELSQFGAGPHFCLGYHLAWLEAVQFAVALGQAMTQAKRRPALVGPLPEPIYLPTERPPTKTKVQFVR